MQRTLSAYDAVDEAIYIEHMLKDHTKNSKMDFVKMLPFDEKSNEELFSAKVLLPEGKSSEELFLFSLKT